MEFPFFCIQLPAPALLVDAFLLSIAPVHMVHEHTFPVFPFPLQTVQFHTARLLPFSDLIPFKV